MAMRQRRNLTATRATAIAQSVPSSLAVMSEQAFNIKFVRVIRKYPCVYDSTRKEYCLRHVIDAAWSGISKEVGEDVKTCKERWKNIRTVFRRNILCQEGGMWKRPYYLFEEMQFMIPFLQKRVKGVLPSPQHLDDPKMDLTEISCQEDAEEPVVDFIKREPAEDPLDVVEAVIKSHPADDRGRRRDDPADEEDLEPEVASRTSKDLWEQWDRPREGPVRKRWRPECVCSSDPNLQFLLSLKPDLDQMRMEQKRRFKKGIFDLLSAIMDGEPESKAASSSSSSIQ